MDKKRAIILYMKLAFLIAFLLTFLSCQKSVAQCRKPPIRIAVIDTGFGFNDQGHDAKLCRYGHKDFSIDRQFSGSYATKVPLPLDVHGHGTNIVGIIESYLKPAHINYCIVVIKYYSESQTGKQNLTAEIDAFKYAANLKVDYINYSGGGPEQSKPEKAAVTRFLKNGGKLIAAAGNGNEFGVGVDIDTPGNEYYPAKYDNRIIVVGNTCQDGVRCNSSNYGKSVTRWEVGEKVSAYGITMTGTSQATAVATGKIVAESSNKCDIGF